MAHMLSTGGRAVAIDDIPGDLFALFRTHEVRTVQFARIEIAFYGSTWFEGPLLADLRSEAAQLLERLRAAKEAAVAREKHVHAREPAVRRSILAPFVDADPWVRRLGEIVALCDEALAAGRGVASVGD